MNSDIIKGKWSELKGELHDTWGKLTHDELEQTKGNISAIAGLIQQRYGETKENVMAKLNSMFAKGEGDTKDAASDATKWAADKTEAAKEKLRETPAPGRGH